MGLLRFILACNVLMAHTVSGYAGAIIAVPSFYIISGFYMALILSEKYIKKNNSYKLFITNRFLRIFPLYLVMLAVMFLLALIKFVFHIGGDNAIEHILTLSHGSTVFFVNYILRNLTLIVTTDYVSRIQATDGYLLVQQAPTLQVELLFYLLAPLIVRLRNTVFGLVSFIYGLLFFTVIPTFFPHTLIETFFANAIFFLLGIVSYKVFVKVKKRRISRRVILFTTASFLVATVIFAFVSNTQEMKNIPNLSWAYYLFLFPIIPVVFLFKNKIDIFFGELSYPLYLSHFLVIKLLQNIFHFSNQVFFTFVVMGISLGASMFLVTFLEEPIDRFRQRRLH